MIASKIGGRLQTIRRSWNTSLLACSVWYLTKTYFDTPTFLRKNISWLILCGVSGNRDLRLILRDHAFGNIDIDTMTRMYQFAKQKRDPHEMNFLKIYLPNLLQYYYYYCRFFF
jgi:hypothetical protein